MAKRIRRLPKLDDLEMGAAAAAAFVVGGRAQRRDLGGIQMRDFDLCYRDGRAVEPLEVTRFIDRATLETWKRLETKNSTAPDLRACGRSTLRAAKNDPMAPSKPFDVDRFLERAELLLCALEERGQWEFEVPGPPGDNVLQGLAHLGCDVGSSRTAGPGETGRIEVLAPAGGVTHRDSVAWAVEHEAAKADNQEKLGCIPDAKRRHLFVVPHPSAVAVYLSVRHGEIGRLPALPTPITTAWVWDGNSPRVFVATPPAPWEDHGLPRDLLSKPEKWVG